MHFTPEQTHIITFKINKPKNLVYEKLQKIAKIRSIKDNILEIKLAPQFLDAFAPRGRIRIELSDFDNNNNTILNCNITQTSFTKTTLYLITAPLAIWTIFAILFFNIFILLTIIVGWLILYFIIRMTQTLNIAKLDNYVFHVVRQIE